QRARDLPLRDRTLVLCLNCGRRTDDDAALRRRGLGLLCLLRARGRLRRLRPRPLLPPARAGDVRHARIRLQVEDPANFVHRRSRSYSAAELARAEKAWNAPRRPARAPCRGSFTSLHDDPTLLVAARLPLQ